MKDSDELNCETFAKLVVGNSMREAWLNEESIDVRVSRIRPKIGNDPLQPECIKAVRSKGYLFVKEI